MNRTSVSTGSPFESIVGISRAVRIGGFIAVSGTAPIGEDGKTVAPGDVASQARWCFELSLAAIEELGADIADVIRTRMLLTRIDDWEAVARVHKEIFRSVLPASTILQVSRFIDPKWLVETELDAVIKK